MAASPRAAVGFFGRGICRGATRRRGSAVGVARRLVSHARAASGSPRCRRAPTTPSTCPTATSCEVLIPWGTPLFAGQPRRGRRTARTPRPTRPGRSASTTTACTSSRSARPLRQPARAARRQPRVHRREPDLHRRAGAAITDDAAGREKVAKALAGHGVTRGRDPPSATARWAHVQGSPLQPPHHRHDADGVLRPVRADHPDAAVGDSATPPPGTLNNCAHGVTPWGTYLACEENWNGYFGTDDPTWAPTALEARYGVTAAGFGYNWHKAEPRFDLAREPQRAQPLRLGRRDRPARSRRRRRSSARRSGAIKHEGATVTEQNGRVVVYTGDDENGDYLYKFVGNAPVAAAARPRQEPARPRHALRRPVPRRRHRHLAAARARRAAPLTAANGWVDQADVLIRTRRPPTRSAPRSLHRPEWVAVNHQHRRRVRHPHQRHRQQRRGQQRP